MKKQKNQHRQTVLLSIAAIMLFLLSFTSGCGLFKSSATKVDRTPPPAGQKLNGYYEHGFVPKESYMFKEDGSYIYDSGDKTKSAVKGTYRIEGETIRLEAGGKTDTKTISVPKEDVGKSSPSKVDLNYGTFEFVKKDSDPVPAGYERFYPEQVGSNKRTMFHDESSLKGNEKNPFIEVKAFSYGEGYPYALNVWKYASEAGAKAQFDKLVSEAVPTEEYMKKVKYPKCFKEGEGDKMTKAEEEAEKNFHPPDELIKRIPVKGGEAVVIRPPRVWEADCKTVSTEKALETVWWMDGVYLMQIDVTVAVGHPEKFQFGTGETFLKDYLSATGQK